MHNDKITCGFVGDINSHLLALEKSITNTQVEDIETPLANTMMTFMVKGLLSKLEFPYAHFPANRLKGDLLHDPFWEAVYRLERLGMKVLLHISPSTYS